MAVKQVEHTGTKFNVLVDDEDSDILVKAWWLCFKGDKNKLGYRKVKRDLRKDERVNGKRAKTSLHREVWEKHFGPIPDGHEIDHINYDTCDNRKENLRLLTKKDNNERKRKKKETANVQQMVKTA